MTLLKLPFLISTTWGINFTMTPPQSPPPQKERVPPTGLELVAPWFPIVAKVGGHYVVQASFWVLAVCEASIILTDCIDHPFSSEVRHLLTGHPNSSGRIYISPLFLSGWFMNLVGTLLRRHCYRMLDSLFTFELSIRKNHHLVTTGPYSVVRHPSYTGAILSGVGVALCHLSRGSWLLECSGILPDSWLIFWSILGFGAFVVTMALGSRMKKEDTILKERFGNQWVQWATRVRYKLFPGVI
ncbi:hypothetical protein BDZ94DRAFT_66993 [Collybia nuda]|uniref:Protein-S-isoprenylcysteine O-methyltransferase n=1 Tax=Collybia nuda TaxID=64659 RepID=A0A9P6CFA3_9AGAR|nr:hypothetical protein BDZ94DRAFT_66993 [Collybia nuda]